LEVAELDARLTPTLRVTVLRGAAGRFALAGAEVAGCAPVEAARLRGVAEAARLGAAAVFALVDFAGTVFAVTVFAVTAFAVTAFAVTVFAVPVFGAPAFGAALDFDLRATRATFGSGSVAFTSRAGALSSLSRTGLSPQISSR
jgi:hypothetical protein